MPHSSPTGVRLPDVPTEPFGVFEVQQLTRSTALESIVAADWVRIAAGKTSEIHRHNQAETILWIVEGSGTVVVADTEFAVEPGARIAIGKGVYHGVRTSGQSLTFLSVQCPPILNHETGTLDLEPETA